MRAFTSRPAVLLLATILAFTGGLFVALLPIAPGSAPLQEGDLAFRTIRAPRDISFESPALTAKRRDEAAAAVPESLVYHPSLAITPAPPPWTPHLGPRRSCPFGDGEDRRSRPHRQAEPLPAQRQPSPLPR